MYQAGRDNCNIAITSSTWGCGALHEDKWFQLRWPETIQEAHITIKELVPVGLGLGLGLALGHWKGKNVMSYCNNAAVVAIVNQGDSKEQEAMYPLHCLEFLKAKHQFLLYASHISGVNNDLANALSRNNLHYFMLHFPQAQLNPTPLPPELLDLTIVKKPCRLDRLVEGYFRSGLALSTQRSYSSAKRGFLQFTVISTITNRTVAL